MKTDSLFYRLFLEFPEIFFELIGNSAQTAQAYQFASVEIKQTGFRIDGVFLPVQDEANPIYFVEVQFQTDLEIYSRLFSEICLYLRQNKPQNDWRGVLIYPTRSLDTADIKHYREYFDSQRVRCIYLDELGAVASLPIGIAVLKLIIEDEDKAILQARELINRITQNADDMSQKQLLQLIETIIIYKFPNMNIEEIQEMFSLSDLKKTKVYQQGREEGRNEGREEGERRVQLQAVPQFLKLGLTNEQIAAALGLSVEEVRQIVQQHSRDNLEES